jgi:phosphohistidine phosphatase
MALYLVQHAKGLSKAVDPDQGVSETGISETRRMAKLVADHGVSVHRIHHSTKTRARQTAEIFAEALSPRDGLHAMEGIKPMDDVTAVASDLRPEDDLMLVGHLPFMARLASFLITGRIDPPVIQFQNSGVVCLDRPPEAPSWQIIWTFMPMVGGAS